MPGRLYEIVADLPMPTVAAIHGYCIGGGFEMSLACDVRIAETTAVFGLPEAALGILPSSGGLTRLVSTVRPFARERSHAVAGAVRGQSRHRLWPGH